jgi:hypothetical protein
MTSRIFFALFVVVILLVGCYDFNNPVDPGGDNYQGFRSDPAPGSSYRREVTISNAGSALSDYQVRIQLTTVDMGSPYQNVNADGSDLRFTDPAETPLSYWVESWNDTGDSLIWVKVPSLPAGSSTIYMSYGDPSASSQSDGAATFLFFDDFEDHAAGEIADGWLPALQVVADGGAMVLDDGIAPGQPVIAQHVDYENIAVRQKFRFVTVSGGNDHAGLIMCYQDDTHLVYGGAVTPLLAQIWEKTGGGFIQIGSDGAVPDLGTGWHVQELWRSGNSVKTLIDNTEYVLATTAAPVLGKTGFWSQYNNRGYRDWHLVRKKAAPEPETSVGAEQAL